MRKLTSVLVLALGLLRAAGAEPETEEKRFQALRKAIGEIQKTNPEMDDLVFRSNLPLARLKLRKVELLLTPGKYRGKVEKAAAWELGQGFHALERIRRKKVAYAGEKGGFNWPYNSVTMQFKRPTANPNQSPYGNWPTYYEYGMEASNDGSPQPFLVEVPPGYDPSVKWPLLIYLHGYHGRVDMIRKWDTTRAVTKDAMEMGYLVLAPHGRSETDFLSVGEADVLQALGEMKRYYNIDENRVYLVGGSMGGYGALNLTFHYPHLFAATAAFTASSDMMLFGKLDRRKLVPFRRWHFLWDNPIDLCANAPHIPIFGVYGSKDTWVPPRFGAQLSWARKSVGGLYELSITAGGGHGVGNAGPAYRKALEWFRGKRQLVPVFIRHKTYSLRYDRSFWARILRIEQWGKAAEFEVSVVDDTIFVKTRNIDSFELELDRPLVHGAKRARIIVNNTDEDRVKLDGPRAVQFDVNPGTRKAGQKMRAICGPFEDIFNYPFLVVRGTAAEKEPRRTAARRMAEQFRVRWEEWTDGWPRMKDDSEVSERDIKDYGLFLLGRPSENSITARIAENLPIQFDGDAFVFQGERYKGSDLGMVLIYPNPLNPARYVAVMAGTFYGLNLPVNHPFGQVPDYMIYEGKPVARSEEGYSKVFGRPNRHLIAGFFNSDWQVDERMMWK